MTLWDRSIVAGVAAALTLWPALPALADGMDPPELGFSSTDTTTAPLIVSVTPGGVSRSATDAALGVSTPTMRARPETQVIVLPEPAERPEQDAARNRAFNGGYRPIGAVGAFR